MKVINERYAEQELILTDFYDNETKGCKEMVEHLKYLNISTNGSIDKSIQLVEELHLEIADNDPYSERERKVLIDLLTENQIDYSAYQTNISLLNAFMDKNPEIGKARKISTDFPTRSDGAGHDYSIVITKLKETGEAIELSLAPVIHLSDLSVHKIFNNDEAITHKDLKSFDGDLNKLTAILTLNGKEIKIGRE